MNERQPKNNERAQLSREGVPRIWIGSLADYNNGNLHGEWIDAAQDPDELREQITAMLGRSKQPDAEEYAIFDYDEFGGLRIGEYESLEAVSAVAKGIAEHGEPFAAWACDIGVDEAAKDVDLFPDVYIGHFDSPEEFARAMWEDLGFNAELDKAVPESLSSFVSVDYTGWALDMRLGGEVTYLDASDGGVYVFRNF